MTTSKQLNAAGIVVIALTIAIAAPAHAQNRFSLDSASLGTTRITLTIPKSVHRTPGRSAMATTRSTYPLTAHVSNAHQGNCLTGAPYVKWVSIQNINGRPQQNHDVPKGVRVVFDHAPMSLPSEKSRNVAIEVDSNAPPASLTMSIVIPRGRCGGSEQEARVAFTLVKAP